MTKILTSPSVQGAGATSDRQLDESVLRAIDNRRGRGQPMADEVRGAMEASFGHDLSAVRVHTDRSAHELNQAVSARAFTTGSDVFFTQGTYRPDSSSGKQLLAHELAHVVQQRTGSNGLGAGQVSQPADAAEQQAEKVGRIVAHRSAGPAALSAGGASTTYRAVVMRGDPDEEEPQTPPGAGKEGASSLVAELNDLIKRLATDADMPTAAMFVDAIRARPDERLTALKDDGVRGSLIAWFTEPNLSLIMSALAAGLGAYRPGWASTIYYKGISPESRQNIDEAVNHEFQDKTGIERALTWDDPVDRPLARLWLVLRDEAIERTQFDPEFAWSFGPDMVTDLRRGDGIEPGTEGFRPHVAALQRALNSFEFHSPVGLLKVDGRFGPLTDQALYSFQIYFELLPERPIDAETAELLMSKGDSEEWVDPEAEGALEEENV